MVKYIDIMRGREDEIGKLVKFLSDRSKAFTKPQLIMTGGYALRAFAPFSRSTRDCDFVLKKGVHWHLDVIKQWLPGGVSLDALEKRGVYGYMRWIKLLKFDGKSAKASIDFMEGQVRGRTQKQVAVIDDTFVKASERVKIKIADEEYEVYVPDYTDYLVLKVVSARPSDVRDIVALVWKNDVPDNIKRRVKEMLPYPEIFLENLRMIIPVISDKRFLNSWRGTFVTTELDENAKNKVIKRIQRLI